MTDQTTTEARPATLAEQRLEALRIVAEGRAHTREHYRQPITDRYVGQHTVADFDAAIDVLVDWAQTSPPEPVPTRTDLLDLVDGLITAAGEHRNARLDEAAARRDMHTGALTDAITQSRKALAAEQTAAAALRTAITAAVPA